MVFSFYIDLQITSFARLNECESECLRECECDWEWVCCSGAGVFLLKLGFQWQCNCILISKVSEDILTFTSIDPAPLWQTRPGTKHDSLECNNFEITPLATKRFIWLFTNILVIDFKVTEIQVERVRCRSYHFCFTQSCNSKPPKVISSSSFIPSGI